MRKKLRNNIARYAIQFRVKIIINSKNEDKFKIEYIILYTVLDVVDHLICR